MKHNKLLVYGTLKRNYSNFNYFLKDAKFLCEVRTLPKYTMYNLGGFPGVTLQGNDRITGHIFEINPETLKQLDRFEGHPNHFKRTLIQLDMNSFDDVWMYVYNRPVSTDRIIKDGVWIEGVKSYESM